MAADSVLDLTHAMFAEGASVEDMLKFLRERGCSKIESMKILMDLKKISLAEAKRLVHLSATWKRERKRDEAFHEAVDDTLQGVE